MVRVSTLSCMSLIAVSLSGCASPSTRIATSLQRYGIDRAQATCMGTRLQSSLSLGQLRQLGRAAGELEGASGRPLRPDDLFRAAARIDDLKVPVEVAKAAGSCGLLASRS